MQITRQAREAVLEQPPPVWSPLWWFRPTNVKRLQWPCASGCLALKGLSFSTVTAELTTTVTKFLHVDVCLLLAIVVVFALFWEHAMNLLKKAVRPLIDDERKSNLEEVKKWVAKLKSDGKLPNEDIPLPLETKLK